MRIAKEVCLKREQVNNGPEIKGRGSHVENTRVGLLQGAV